MAQHRDKKAQSILPSQSKESIKSLPINYIRKPKSQQNSRYYFFLSTLLIFFTIFTIILACGLSVYFVLKSLFEKEDGEGLRRDNSEMRFDHKGEIELPKYKKFVDEEI